MISEEQLAKLSIYEAILVLMPIVRKDFIASKYKRKITNLINQIKKSIEPSTTQSERFNLLHAFFYQDWKFSGPNGAYKFTDILWLDKVIDSRCGSSGILGMLFIHIAKKIGLDVHPITFPDQMLLRIDLPDNQTFFMHPSNGGFLTMHEVKSWVTGVISPFQPFDNEILYPEKNMHIVIRLIDTLKTALIAEQSLAVALKITEVLLTLYPDDPYERRDRGLIYAKIGCSHIAAEDLDYFVEQCPNDPLVDTIRRQRSLISPETMVFH